MFTRPTGHPNGSSAADSQPAAAELLREDEPETVVIIDQGPQDLVQDDETEDDSALDTEDAPTDKPEGESQPEE